MSAGLLALVVGAALAGCAPTREAPSVTPEPSQTVVPAPTTPPETTPPETSAPEATSPPEPDLAPTTDEAPVVEDVEDFSTADQTSPTWPDHSVREAYLTQVRAAAQDGFDRVVLEFPGPQVPSYDVRYVDSPIAEGSGEVIDIEGTAFLRVGTARVVVPEFIGQDDADLVTGPSDTGDATISGLWSEGPWEGHAATHIGLEAVRDFRVTTLADPARIVVDIKH